MDGVPVAEDIEPETRPVDVIQVAGGNLQWVALQCEIVEGSTPTPAIQWRRKPVGSDPGTVPGDILAEDFTSNTIHFVDRGEWLILETDESAITGLEYFCEVTNKQRFQTVRGSLTYTLNPGGPLSLLHSANFVPILSSVKSMQKSYNRPAQPNFFIKCYTSSHIFCSQLQDSLMNLMV